MLLWLCLTSPVQSDDETDCNTFSCVGHVIPGLIHRGLLCKQKGEPFTYVTFAMRRLFCVPFHIQPH
jgi:hypothetical protein